MTSERDRLQALEDDNASLAVEVADRLDAQRLSEERLRFATEAAAIGVWEISLPDMTLTATATVGAIYGLAPGTVLTVALIRAAAHPDDAPRVFDLFDRTARGEAGATYHSMHRIVRADGAIGWVEGRGELVRDGDGMPRKIIGVSQDVSARREAEARLELNEESLRLATDVAGVGTWDLTLATDTLTWSDLTRAMFGISPGVAVSMADFYAGLHPDDLSATTTAFAAALDPAVRAVYDVEFRVVGKEDGAIPWVTAR
ncbi:MAG: PAS domain-containing protein, partial [Sphingomonadaceae bacterium]|nr:PAS domain-containing protein [Sphingomonadaceae bacterium]